MRSKIIIHLGPKLALPIDLSFLNIPKGKPGIVDVINKLNILVSFVFLLGILIWELLGGSLNTNLITIIFGTVIVLLALNICKLIISKQELLSQIPFDIPLLTVTTIVAMSLFTGTAIFKNTTNIWGGANLRAIAGVSLIAFWFLYYLLASILNGKKMLQQALVSFWLAPIVALLTWLLTFRDFINPQISFLSMLLPGSLILVLTQTKHRPLHIINLVIAIVMLFVGKDIYAIFITIVTFFVTFLIIIIKHRNSLGEKFRALDNFPKKRQEIASYINNNFIPLYLLFSTIVIIAGIFWLKDNMNKAFFYALTLGFQSISFAGIGNLLMGNGLNTIAASTVMRFVNIYGLIPCLAILASLFFIVKNILKAYKKTSSQSNRGLFIWLATLIGMCFTYLLLTPISSDLLVSIMFLALLFLGLFSQLILTKTKAETSLQIRSFEKIKNLKLRLALTIGQYVLIVAIILAVIYLLSSINYINIFLMSN